VCTGGNVLKGQGFGITESEEVTFCSKRGWETSAEVKISLKGYVKKGGGKNLPKKSLISSERFFGMPFERVS